MRSRFIVLAAGMAALTAIGCGEQQIDVEKSAKLIQSAVEEQVGADVKSISCPDEVKVQAKATFPCVVKAPDRQGQRGLSVVRSRSELEAAVTAALDISRSGTLLVESFVAGREVTVTCAT